MLTPSGSKQSTDIIQIFLCITDIMLAKMEANTFQFKIYDNIVFKSSVKSYAALNATFMTKVRAEMIKMCLRDQHSGTCACEIISRITRIVEV